MARCGVAVLVLILLACVALAAAGGGDHHRPRGSRASARLQLVPAAPGASLAERARDDRHRHAYISTRLASSASSSRRRAAETSTAPGPEASAFAMPLTSGAYTGTGQYFVRFRVGTPAQPFVLVADTGSDLTWVKCRGASSPSTTPGASPRVFRPADSKSWAPFPCSSDTCKSYVPFSLANCSAGTAPCAYDYRAYRRWVRVVACKLALSVVYLVHAAVRKDTVPPHGTPPSLVQGQLVGPRRGGHGRGHHRALRLQRLGPEGEAAGGGAGLHHLLRRPELPGLRRRAQPRQQQHLLRRPRRRALRRPLLLLPRRPPRPAQHLQLPHLRPRRLQRRRAVAVEDAAAARRPGGPVLRRHGRRRLRRRRGARHPRRGVGRQEERRRHPRLRHQPHHPRHPGVQGRRGRSEQAAGGSAKGDHGPVRVLLQLDGHGHAAGRPEAGGAVRRVGAAPAAHQELRHRRGARRQVHRAAGGRLARGVRHRQHPAAGAPLGVRPRQPLA
ncbi:hypothetical protein ACQJBY_004005 [Aegilops geniculata]